MEELKHEETSAESEALSPEEKASREWERFEKFYKQLLVGSGAVLLMGIVLAVLVSVVVGAAVFLSGCGIYLYFAKDELKRRMGLGYKRVLDGWAVTPASTKGREMLWIPPKLMGLPVTELFAPDGDETAVRELYLPTSVLRLEEGALEHLPNLEKIVYLGGEEEWKKVEMPPLPTDCELILVDQTKRPD
jgi:hypothetical protein